MCRCYMNFISVPVYAKKFEILHKNKVSNTRLSLEGGSFVLWGVLIYQLQAIVVRLPPCGHICPQGGDIEHTTRHHREGRASLWQPHQQCSVFSQ